MKERERERGHLKDGEGGGAEELPASSIALRGGAGEEEEGGVKGLAEDDGTKDLQGVAEEAVLHPHTSAHETRVPVQHPCILARKNAVP